MGLGRTRAAPGLAFRRPAQDGSRGSRRDDRDEHEDGQIRGHVRAMLAPGLWQDAPQRSDGSGVS